MKTFSTNGTGSQQTLSEIESDKMPIYNTMADVEVDLANLEENQIVATKDIGDELSQPVNTVEAGNLHAVTSNAVANAFNLGGLSAITISANEAFYIDKSGFLTITGQSSGNAHCELYINGEVVCDATVHNDYSDVPFSFLFPVKEGDRISLNYNPSYVTINNTFIREFNFN